MGSGLRVKQGFVVVDVMAALAILAATLSLTMMALTTAFRVERAAAERRAALALLQGLADRPFERESLEQGTSGPLHWRAELQALDEKDALANCRLKVTVNAGGRDYDLSTIRPCPATELAR